MPVTRSKVADVLFAIQALCALLFGVTQIGRLFDTTQGVSLTWFVFWAIFLGLNLHLAVKAHHAQPSRVTAQTIVIYALWSAVLALALGVLLWRSLGAWFLVDSLNVGLSGLGIMGVLGIARRHQLGIADPIVRGWLAVFFKGTPQLTLAWHLTQVGGAGLAPFAILAGHFTICLRLGQLYFSIKEAGWDRNRMGSAISEIANELSWIVATIVWLLV